MRKLRKNHTSFENSIEKYMCTCPCTCTSTPNFQVNFSVTGTRNQQWLV